MERLVTQDARIFAVKLEAWLIMAGVAGFVCGRAVEQDNLNRRQRRTITAYARTCDIVVQPDSSPARLFTAFADGLATYGLNSQAAGQLADMVPYGDLNTLVERDQKRPGSLSDFQILKQAHLLAGIRLTVGHLAHHA